MRASLLSARAVPMVVEASELPRAAAQVLERAAPDREVESMSHERERIPRGAVAAVAILHAAESMRAPLHRPDAHVLQAWAGLSHTMRGSLLQHRLVNKEGAPRLSDRGRLVYATLRAMRANSRR